MKHQRRKLTKRELAAATSRRGAAVRRITAKPRPARAALLEEVAQVLDGQHPDNEQEDE